jgi:hypothetical protein
VLAGGYILACASFKLWVHDKLGQLLAKWIDGFHRGLGTKPTGQPSPAEAEEPDRRQPPDGHDQPPGGSGPPDIPDDLDQSSSGSGPPPAPSSGSAVSNPPSGLRQTRPMPPARPAPALAAKQPFTADGQPASTAPGPQGPEQNRRIPPGQRLPRTGPRPARRPPNHRVGADDPAARQAEPEHPRSAAPDRGAGRAARDALLPRLRLPAPASQTRHPAPGAARQQSPSRR